MMTTRQQLLFEFMCEPQITGVLRTAQGKSEITGMSAVVSGILDSAQRGVSDLNRSFRSAPHVTALGPWTSTDNRLFRFRQDIDNGEASYTKNCHALIQWLIDHQVEYEINPDPDFYVEIEFFGGGGESTLMYAVIDAMSNCPFVVKTKATGRASSAVLMMFMSGDKGYRRVGRYIKSVSHMGGPSRLQNKPLLLKLLGWWIWSTSDDYKQFSEKTCEFYMRATGRSRKFIRKNLIPPYNKDVVLDAEKLVEWGLADEIIGDDSHAS